MNLAEEERSFIISVTGPDGIRLIGNSEVKVGSAENLQVPMQARVPKASQAESVQIVFEVVSKDYPDLQRKKKAVFLYPN
jgi:glycine cleavage system regulatory protein